MNKVVTTPIEAFEGPVKAALQAYSGISDERVTFDTDTASHLVLTPDKPNSARSVSVVKHLGVEVAKLFVIAFKNEDGTGDESAFKLDDSMLSVFYPLVPRVVPRSKAGVHSEAHLTIASFFPNLPEEDPLLFAGHLDLVGLKNGRLARNGILGQNLHDFTQATIRERVTEPTVTYTTGYHENGGQRFGDPHSVFNNRFFEQLCGFIAVPDELAPEHAVMLKHLGAVEPELQF